VPLTGDLFLEKEFYPVPGEARNSGQIRLFKTNRQTIFNQHPEQV